MLNRTGIVVVTLLLCSACSDQAPTAPKPSPAKSRQWFEGGTLHKKSGAEWLKASHEDRLATAADFLASLNKPTTMAELNGLKPKAENVVQCVSKALERPKGISEQKWKSVREMPVTELAAPCIKLLGYR